MANETTKRLNTKKAFNRALWLEESTYYDSDGGRSRKVDEHHRIACIVSSSDAEIIHGVAKEFGCSIKQQEDFVENKNCVLLELDFAKEYARFVDFSMSLKIKGVSDIVIVPREEKFVGNSELYLKAIQDLVKKFNNRFMAI